MLYGDFATSGEHGFMEVSCNRSDGDASFLYVVVGTIWLAATVCCAGNVPCAVKALRYGLAGSTMGTVGTFIVSTIYYR